MSTLPEFLTVDEAAELLRVDRNTLYGAIEKGQIPGVLRVGRAIRISRQALSLIAGPQSGDLATGKGSESSTERR